VLKGYFKVAVRTMLRQRGYSLINIAGLAVGMACCLIITGYIISQLSYDDYHADNDRIYRVDQIERTKSAVSYDANTAPPLGPALLEIFDEVEYAARLLPANRLLKSGDHSAYENKFYYADQDIFNILSFPFLYGDSATALVRPNSIVLTHHVAEKFFGRVNPIGQILTVNDKEFEVTGVIADPPRNSHIICNALASLNYLQDSGIMNHWLFHAFYSYIKLKPGVDASDFGHRIKRIGDKYALDVFNEHGYSYDFVLQAVPDLHLYSHPYIGPEPSGNPLYLYLFGAVGLLVLLIACLNFVNLTTARSMTRAHEIGLRKVVGANRLQLFRQFMGESLLLVFLAAVIALALSEILIPHINAVTGTALETGDFARSELLWVLFGLLVLVGLAAGVYPALFLSRFHPSQMLRGHAQNPTGGMTLRSILVVVQFTISIVLIIGTLAAHRQMAFMQDRDLGMNMERKLVVPVRGGLSLRSNYQEVKNEFLRHPVVTAVSASSEGPGHDLSCLYTKVLDTEEGRVQSIPYIFIDGDYLTQYDIAMIAGRAYQNEFSSDSTDAFIINKSAVAALGFTSPEEALGHRMECGYGDRDGIIIGVTEDFHFMGLQEPIGPLVLAWIPPLLNHLNLTLKANHLRENLEGIKNIWHRLYPDHPFEYYFHEETFNRQYQAEERLGRLFGLFAFLGVMISCLGLLGLVSFMVERRAREIGIRKVLGATVSGVVMLLSRDFAKWILLANLVAWPLAYIAIRRWLNDFAYRINLGFDIFILSGLLVILVALITVSFQSVKAALTNPAEVLKCE